MKTTIRLTKLAVITVALFSVLAFAVVNPTQAQTYTPQEQELRTKLFAMIAQLQQLILSLQAAQTTPTTINDSSFGYTFTDTDKAARGSEGENVRWLQKALNKLGYTIASQGDGSPGSETTYFGPATENALKRFQAAQGIVSSGTPESTGYGAFGPSTRAKMNAVLAEKNDFSSDSEDEDDNSSTDNDDEDASSSGGDADNSDDGNDSDDSSSEGDEGAPTVSNGSPSGSLSYTTNSVTLRVSTNEDAECRYSASPNQSFDSMSSNMTGTQTHSASLSVSAGVSYTRYVKCQDEFDNTSSDYVVSFSVNSAPSGGDTDEPYDLGSVPFSYSWPAEPVTTQTINVDTMDEFQAAVSQSNVRIVVAEGTYTGDLNITGDDVDIVVSNNAIIYGDVEMRVDNERIRWTGGNIHTIGDGRVHVRGARDLLFDDVYIKGSVQVIGNSSRRVAVINSTVEHDTTGDFSLFMSPNSGRNEDIIYANIRVDSPTGVGNGTNRNQHTDRMVVVDSVFNMGGHLSTGFRVGENTDELYVADSMITGRIFHSYNEFGNVNVTNATYDNVTRYTNSISNVGNRFASFNAGVANTGTVNNSQLYSYNPSDNGDSLNIGQFSVPSGGSNPTVRVWSDDISDLPDVSSYGAGRNPFGTLELSPVPNPEPEPDSDPEPDPLPDSDELYDLGSVPFSYSWPEEPSVSQVINVTANSFAELQSAVSQSNAQVIVPAGTYVGDLHITGSDLDVVLSEDATIQGVLTWGDYAAPVRTARVRWTGGNLEGGMRAQPIDDLLVDNFYVDSDANISPEGINNMSGVSGAQPSGWNRMAWINSTIKLRNGTGGWAWYQAGDGQDMIMANVKMISEGSQNNRFIGITNLIIVDSVFNPDGLSTNGMRIHNSTTNVFMRDSWMQSFFKMDEVNEDDTGPQVLNGTFLRVDRYEENAWGTFAFFGDAPNTGTVNDSTIYSQNEPTTGTPSLGTLTGSGNTLQPWDGVTVPNHSNVGAVR